MFSSKVLFVATCFASLLVEPTFAAIRPQDRANTTRTCFTGPHDCLDGTNDAHVRAYKAAVAAGRKKDRQFYEDLGILPPLGGAHAAPGGFGYIDFTDDDSMRYAAPLILHHYKMPHKDDLYINATFDLLKMHSRVPTKAEIEHLYDSRLTPFIRRAKRLIDTIDTATLHHVQTEAQAVIDTIPADGLNVRTVAGCLDAQAAISFIKQAIEQQIDLLQAAADLTVLDSDAYQKRTFIVNIFYGGNDPFQKAASNTTPSMFDVLSALFNKRSLAIYRLENALIMDHFDVILAQCNANQHLPLISWLKLPAPGGGNTSPRLASTIIDRMEPKALQFLSGLINKYLPQPHAGAILHVLLQDKDTAALYANLDKFIHQKPQETQKKARSKFGILEALAKRESSLDATKKIIGPGARQEVKTVMDNLHLLLQNAVDHGEK